MSSAVVAARFFSVWEGDMGVTSTGYLWELLLPRNPVVSLSELKGAVLMALKELMSLMSVGSSYICL